MTLTLDLHLPHHSPPAVFSPDRRYRYLLTRRWNDNLPALAVVGHNPSFRRGKLRFRTHYRRSKATSTCATTVAHRTRWVTRSNLRDHDHIGERAS